VIKKEALIEFNNPKVFYKFYIHIFFTRGDMKLLTFFTKFTVSLV
jgi:hypothetical protein